MPSTRLTGLLGAGVLLAVAAPAAAAPATVTVRVEVWSAGVAHQQCVAGQHHPGLVSTRPVGDQVGMVG